MVGQAAYYIPNKDLKKNQVPSEHTMLLAVGLEPYPMNGFHMAPEVVHIQELDAIFDTLRMLAEDQIVLLKAV